MNTSYSWQNANDFERILLHHYFTHSVKVPRIMHGKQQELETLINEEALLLAKYLRNERPTRNPRFVALR